MILLKDTFLSSIIFSVNMQSYYNVLPYLPMKDIYRESLPPVQCPVVEIQTSSIALYHASSDQLHNREAKPTPTQYTACQKWSLLCTHILHLHSVFTFTKVPLQKKANLKNEEWCLLGCYAVWLL
jgi:hypothetical protein